MKNFWNSWAGSLLTQHKDAILWVILMLLVLTIITMVVRLAIGLARKNQTIGTPRSGHIMIVQVGEMVTKFIMPGGVDGKNIDRHSGKITKRAEDRGWADKEGIFGKIARWFLKLTGWYWLGLFANVRLTTLQHKEFLSENVVAEGGKRININKLHECEVIVDQIPLRQVFALVAPAVEVHNTRFDPDIFVLVTFEVTDAKKAYVLIEDATLNALSTTQSAIRGWGSKKDYQVLLETQSEAGRKNVPDSLLDSLLGLNVIKDDQGKDTGEGLDNKYGLIISDVDIRQIALPADVRDTLQMEGRAEEVRKAKIKDARADRKSTMLRGEGTAYATRLQREAVGNDNETLERLAIAHSIEKTGVSMLSINTGTPIVPTSDSSNHPRRTPAPINKPETKKK